MKMRKKHILCAFAVTALLLLNGCAQQQSQMKYIGADTAKQTALNAAGLSSAEAESVTADLSTRTGTDYYQVDLTAKGQTYHYDIDALTGVIIDSQTLQAETQSADASGTLQAESQNADTSGASQAALQNAGVSSTSVAQPSTISKSGPDASNNAGSQGNTDSSSSSAVSSQPGMISADEAKAYALAHAGLTSDQVTFTKSKLDKEDGKQVYDVEFYTGNREGYDYEIDAYSGAVISYDFEINGGAAASAGSTITEADAKKLALAQVPGAAESDIREFKTDYDDGRMEYEGKILYGGMEYEFEIDAYSGAIRSWEAEPAKR